MFKVPASDDGKRNFISGDKSEDSVFWMKPSSLISDEKPIADGKKSALSEEISIIDLERVNHSTDGGSGDENNADSSTIGGSEPFDVTRQSVHQRLARLAQFGYQFMRPVRHDEDKSIVCWNMVEAFADDTSTHGVSHVLNTSGNNTLYTINY